MIKPPFDSVTSYPVAFARFIFLLTACLVMAGVAGCTSYEPSGQSPVIQTHDPGQLHQGYSGSGRSGSPAGRHGPSVSGRQNYSGSSADQWSSPYQSGHGAHPSNNAGGQTSHMPWEGRQGSATSQQRQPAYSAAHSTAEDSASPAGNLPDHAGSDYVYMPDHPLADTRGYVKIMSPAETKQSRTNRPNSSPAYSDQSSYTQTNRNSLQNRYPHELTHRLEPRSGAATEFEQSSRSPAREVVRPTVSNISVREVWADNRNAPPPQSQGAKTSPGFTADYIAEEQERENDASGGSMSSSATGNVARNPVESPANKAGSTAFSQPTVEPAIKIGNQPPHHPNSLTQPTVIQDDRYTQTAMPDIRKTIGGLERYVESHPDDRLSQLALRVLYSQQGEHDKALRPFAYAPEQTIDMQNLASSMLLAARINESSSVEKAGLANQALEKLEQLWQTVAEAADLRITNLKICSEVKGYGRYKEIPKNVLETGQPREVLVYCELENFKNQKNEEGKYYTELHAEITLYDSAYKPIGQPLSEDVTDTPSFNKRRDFFLRGPLKIPALSPGKYEIVVSIEDKIAHKIARAQRYSFEVKGLSGVGYDGSAAN